MTSAAFRKKRSTQATCVYTNLTLTRLCINVWWMSASFNLHYAWPYTVWYVRNHNAVTISGQVARERRPEERRKSFLRVVSPLTWPWTLAIISILDLTNIKMRVVKKKKTLFLFFSLRRRKSKVLIVHSLLIRCSFPANSLFVRRSPPVRGCVSDYMHINVLIIHSCSETVDSYVSL